jgi:N-acetylglutamate synthase-like GNAT family acetyltransferase
MRFSVRRNIIRKCADKDVDVIFEIINDAATAYKGVIPSDCWHEPYMPMKQLRWEIDDGVCFWGFEDESGLIGVMGIQDKGEVTLIRHAYVRTDKRSRGIGTQLLRYLETTSEKPILIGTWADAVWAVAFYEKQGYRLLPTEEKNRLLRKFWTISERQVDTSVVLADERWKSKSNHTDQSPRSLGTHGGK